MPKLFTRKFKTSSGEYWVRDPGPPYGRGWHQVKYEDLNDAEKAFVDSGEEE